MMYSYILTFETLSQKQIAVEWILMNIRNCSDPVERLKETNYTFYTDKALSKRKLKQLLQKTQPLSFTVKEI
jgi:hypothetical protein